MKILAKAGILTCGVVATITGLLATRNEVSVLRGRMALSDVAIGGIVGDRALGYEFYGASFKWRWIQPGKRITQTPLEFEKMDILDCWRIDRDGYYAITQFEFEIMTYMVGGRWSGDDARVMQSMPGWTMSEPFSDTPPAYKFERYFDPGTDRHLGSLRFLHNAWFDSSHHNQDGPFSFDICAYARNTAQILIRKGSLIHVWQCRYWYEEDRHIVRGEWRMIDEVSVPFRERFRVFLSGRDYVFVTDSQAIHRATRGPDGTWHCAEVRPAGAKKIVAILADDTNHRAFAFGRDFWFALDDKLQLDKLPEIRCRDVTLGHSDLGEPLRTVANCADVLHEAGVLVSPPAEAEVPMR